MSPRFVLAWFRVAACFLLPGFLEAQPLPATVDFNRDVRPVLSENCFFCHGADARKREGKLRLDVAEEALAKHAIVPGRPTESTLVQRIFSADPSEVMPPPESKRTLTPRQRELLQRWISEGGRYDQHWAFKPLARPSLPAVQQSSWLRDPLDRFVLSALEEQGFSPSREASIETLLRRASLDLTGLPPSPAQLRTWRAKADPFTAAVEDLLASPHFGERQAVDWLDVARYADTHGFNNDSMRSMWRWRDWVIEAFNQNLPYDRFITEQLAGDLLPHPTLNQLVATGFNRNHVINSEGGIIDEEYRVEYVADRVRTLSLAWLGLTLECARCHDHKFDPVSQRDYYRLFAFFNQVEEYGEDGRVANAAPILRAPTLAQQDEWARSVAARLRAEEQLTRLEAMAPTESRSGQLEAPGTSPDLPSGSSWVRLAVEPAAAGGVAVRNMSTNTAPPRWEGGEAYGTNLAGLKTARFTGTNQLVLEQTRPGDSAKGWVFSAWVKWDGTAAGPLLSSMNFTEPASSQGHGRGLEIRLDDRGAVEVRMAIRWPAYALRVVSQSPLTPGQWEHVVVRSEGGTQARHLHLWVNGEPVGFDLRHDDLTSGIAWNGRLSLGASREPGSPTFRGEMAAVHLHLLGGEEKSIARFARQEFLRGAAAVPKDQRTAAQHQAVRRWLRAQNDPVFAQALTDWRQAQVRRLAIERDMPTTMVMRELATPRPTHLLFRGRYDQPRDIVEPGVPENLWPWPQGAPRNRLGLAQWLTDSRHPLTARVVVNRFWQSLFGTGIVKTTEDFGFQSDWPSHPELLDWLAADFVASGWDVKRLLRQIVLSATYRQDSAVTPLLLEKDPENRWLARAPRFRLAAEVLRDQALELAGLRSSEVGGPPVYPYQPANLYKGIIVAANYPGTTYEESSGSGLFRRSLYTFWKRTVPHPSFTTFDAPDREFCVGRRLRTNTPLQALALMNDPIQVEAARKFAERILREGGRTDEERIAYGFELATGRSADAQELSLLHSLLDSRRAHYAAHPDSASAALKVGRAGYDPSLGATPLAAYAQLASLLLNLDETITRH